MVKQIISVALVDDDAGVRSALGRLLRSSGMVVNHYGSGADFIASLSNEVPTCVVLDLHMPVMSGFDVMQRLHDAWPTVPVVVATGNHSVASLARVLTIPPVAYVLKPVDSQLLIDVIHLACDPEFLPNRQRMAPILVSSIAGSNVGLPASGGKGT